MKIKKLLFLFLLTYQIQQINALAISPQYLYCFCKFRPDTTAVFECTENITNIISYTALGIGFMTLIYYGIRKARNQNFNHRRIAN